MRFCLLFCTGNLKGRHFIQILRQLNLKFRQGGRPNKKACDEGGWEGEKNYKSVKKTLTTVNINLLFFIHPLLICISNITTNSLLAYPHNQAYLRLALVLEIIEMKHVQLFLRQDAFELMKLLLFLLDHFHPFKYSVFPVQKLRDLVAVRIGSEPLPAVRGARG